MTWYCDYAIGDPVHGHYHNNEYGFPVSEDAVLFERLALEINQAGLNWGLILRKREAFRNAFDQWDIERISRYRATKRQKLLADASIIRNRLKIDAVVHNASVVLDLSKSHGSFAEWIGAQHPKKKSEWVKLFKKTFRFTGGEITGEFLMSIGYLPGTHRKSCPTYARIKALSPAWMEVGERFYLED